MSKCQTGQFAQTLDHALIRMGNLSNLEIKGVVLDSGFTSLLQNLKQLKECSLERVCMDNAGECRPMALLAVEDLKLVSTCWHGRNCDSKIIRVCLRLKKLMISWHADRANEMDWGENWTQTTCSTLAVIATRLAWPARGEELRRHHVKFISMLRMFPSVIELHIHSSIPPFFETDTEKKPMLVKMVNYRGPIHFLNLSQALPKVRSLNLTDCGLLGQHFREETLHVEEVRELTLDIFSCEEEIVCRLISVMWKLERLKVNISDDVSEQRVELCEYGLYDDFTNMDCHQMPHLNLHNRSPRIITANEGQRCFKTKNDGRLNNINVLIYKAHTQIKIQFNREIDNGKHTADVEKFFAGKVINGQHQCSKGCQLREVGKQFDGANMRRKRGQRSLDFEHI
ncbi:uncharacterized protein C8R40DRAFT_1075009 [Lentinula edodes]|uniref:uncharacterized protein n=1 Tax=Lentinula edodes TaxID=5353 RepID=UPI001E8E40AE|nr:uncharacterized protein C8R40DRAFT_1075009 [Lentinula edodes]KAH7868243.1 hypothetical protein C8R40DRAFT_1075009 [Lentinula edodes]